MFAPNYRRYNPIFGNGTHGDKYYKRHNYTYISGIIHFTPHESNPRTREANSTRSAARKRDRPAATTMKGSSGSTLVQRAGSEARCPYWSRWKTRSSPQLWRRSTKSITLLNCGWNGWVTRTVVNPTGEAVVDWVDKGSFEKLGPFCLTRIIIGGVTLLSIRYDLLSDF